MGLFKGKRLKTGQILFVLGVAGFLLIFFQNCSKGNLKFPGRGGNSTDSSQDTRIPPGPPPNLPPILRLAYYVDPKTGNDSNSGLTPATAWQTIPGTRNAANTSFLRSSWGSINGAPGNRIECGDTILLKGGSSVGSSNIYSTSEVPNGGTLCLAGGAFSTNTCQYDPSGKYFYTNNTCSRENPTIIRIATDEEWSGSRGDFTIDCTGMMPKGASWAGFSGGFESCVEIAFVDGFRFGGTSPTQRLEIKNLHTGRGTGNFNEGGITVSNHGPSDWITDFELAWINSHDHSHGAGIVMGWVKNGYVHDIEVHHNGGPGINCGMASDKICDKVGIERASVHHNATLGLGPNPNICAAFGDAIEIQGSQGLWVLNSDVYSNGCSGMNAGRAQHLYNAGNDVDIIRDTIFRGNGTLPYPRAGAAVGYQGGGDSIPKEGWPSESPYDNYAILQRVIAHGNSSAGLYVQHGSGFSIFLNSTVVGNATNISGNGASSSVQWNQKAGDSGFVSSIAVRGGSNQSIFSYQNAGCTGNGGSIPAGCKVCDQRCTNAGTLCSVDSDCTGCTNSALLNGLGNFEHTCSSYNGKMVVNHSILAPKSSNTESLANFTFKCGTACSNAGASCSTASDCSGCTGGCAFQLLIWPDVGSNFSTPPKFLSHSSNKIGIEFNPLFRAAPASCIDGLDYASCDFRLMPTSPAIDAGTFYLAANGSGTNSFNLTVKQHPDLVAQGVNFNGHFGNPTFFFKSAESFLYSEPDIIQIAGATCAPGIPVLEHGRARVASMTSNSIQLDRPCTWSNNSGISLPWSGSAPDMGAFEF